MASYSGSAIIYTLPRPLQSRRDRIADTTIVAYALAVRGRRRQSIPTRVTPSRSTPPRPLRLTNDSLRAVLPNTTQARMRLTRAVTSARPRRYRFGILRKIISACTDWFLGHRAGRDRFSLLARPLDAFRRRANAEVDLELGVRTRMRSVQHPSSSPG